MSMTAGGGIARSDFCRTVSGRLPQRPDSSMWKTGPIRARLRGGTIGQYGRIRREPSTFVVENRMKLIAWGRLFLQEVFNQIAESSAGTELVQTEAGKEEVNRAIGRFYDTASEKFKVLTNPEAKERGEKKARDKRRRDRLSKVKYSFTRPTC